jgi:hypothetical protein
VGAVTQLGGRRGFASAPMARATLRRGRCFPHRKRRTPTWPILAFLQGVWDGVGRKKGVKTRFTGKKRA